MPKKRPRTSVLGSLASGRAAALIVALGLLSACQAGAEQAANSPLPPSTSDSASNGDSSAVTPTMPARAGWTPSNPLSKPITLSEEVKMSRRAESLDLRARDEGIKQPPKVSLVRWIKPEDYGATMVPCLQDAGFQTSLTDDGEGIYFEPVPRSQRTALNLAGYICAAQYSVDPRYLIPLNEEQRGLKYDYLVEFYVPCVKSLGYTLEDPPSREVYIATPSTEPGWQPASELMPQLRPGGLTELWETCPETVPSDLLYGS